MRPADVVRPAIDRDQLEVRDQVGQSLRGGLERQDSVLGAVDD